MFTFESLEKRQLLSAASLRGATLTIRGDLNRDNVIVVSVADDGDTVEVDFGDGRTQSFDTARIKNINIKGGRRNDDISIIERDGELTGIRLQVFLDRGNDKLDADVTAVRADGGSGNDALLGSTGNDTLLGRDGNDDLFGGAGDDGIWGDRGNDDLRGDDGEDDLWGGHGNDEIDGGKGEDMLDGGWGDDILVDKAESSTRINHFYGGRGIDEFYADKRDKLFDAQPFEKVYYAT